MKRTLTTVALVVAGLGAGAVLAGVAQADVGNKATEYSINPSGETYGSDQYAAALGVPDLIAVVVTEPNEKGLPESGTGALEGYVKSSDYKDATGETAMKTFKSPADALAWQESEGRLDKKIPVYLKDGVTVIGTYTVYGLDSQQKIADNF